MSLRTQLRRLARARMLAVGVVLTLALGIGALTATFGIIDAALFRPPPFEDASRLALIYLTRTSARRGTTRERWSYGRIQLLRQSATSFERTANYSRSSLTLSGEGEPEQIEGEVVAPAYFPLLGVGASRGRTFAESEDVPANASAVVVLGHNLWMRRYAGDVSMVGRTVRVNGKALVVVGVMPPEFRGLSGHAEIWIPTALAPRLTYADYVITNQSFISVVGKLRPGVDVTQARAELGILGARIAKALPLDGGEPGETVGATAITLNEARMDDRRKHSLLILGGAVALLHLLACANVTSLLLGFAAARRREMAVRLALGSSPGRLVSTVLGEGMFLGVTGGVLGVLAAAWGSAYFALPANTWAATNFYGSVAAFDAPSFGWRTLSFGITLTVLTSLFIASAPALTVLRQDLAAGLRDGMRGASVGGVALRRPSARGIIVAAEAALAMVLLVAGGLLIDSFARMRRTNLGVDAENVLSFEVRPSDVRIPPASAPAFVARLLAAIEAVPGVVAATVDGGAPVSGSARSVLYIMGRPAPPPREAPPVLRHYVGPNHFRTLGVPVLRGRSFSASDVAGQPRVAIISQSAAFKFWPNQDPIGQRVWFGGGSNFDSPDSSAEIVGIVGDVVNEPLDLHPNPASFYTPYAQFTYSWRVVMVRTAGDPLAVAGAIRKAVSVAEPDVPLLEMMPLTQRIGGSWARQRFEAALFGGFGTAALLLAVSGIYAVVAYAVARRTREMGIRLALGAPRGAVLRLVVGEGMTLPIAGLLTGGVAALLLTRLLRSSLYEVTPTEPRVFVATVAILIGASFAACLVPARRATLVDPMEALRAE